MLATLGFAIGAGRHHHHGARLLVLVLIVAVVVALAVVLRRGRRPDQPHTRGPAPTPTSHASTSAKLDTSRTVTADARSRGGSHITAKGLVKHYGGKPAVNDLSFTVEPGQVTGFLGPNGAGKSTTMRLIMGLDAPDSGSVLIGGRPFHALGWPLREVGALLEARAVHPGRTAYAHLWMLARSNDIRRARVDEVLDLVGLTSVATQRVGSFSLGMGQRLGIAAALLGDPGVLLFDEPVNGLDTDGIRWARQLLRRLASEGRTVFVSSHLMSEMAITADRVVVIGQGRLIAETSVAEFIARSGHGYVRVRSPQLGTLRSALEQAGGTITEDGDAIAVRQLDEERIGEIAWERSILLHELTPRSASLEEAFVESTEGELQYQGDDAHDEERTW